MSPKIAPAILMFVPDQWGEVERFAKLCEGTYRFDAREKRALAGVAQHFEKALIFRSLAERLAPGLRIDRDQLNAQGFSSAQHSRELAAVTEAAIVELYSCVDCTAKVLRAIYGGQSRGFRDSTRRLFADVDAITGGFPDSLKEVIRGAGWFGRLLFLRDELTHLGAGGCHLPEGAETISYMHTGVTEDGKPLILDDVIGWLDGQFAAVNLFLGQVFGFLRGTLGNSPVTVVCGMVEGRFLMRHVDPTQPLDWSNGRCQSWIWFEQADAPTCPFTTRCGAYARVRGGAAG
jgi:hypothetical protein